MHPIEEAMQQLGVRVRPRFRIREASELNHLRIQLKTLHMNWTVPSVTYLKFVAGRIAVVANRIERDSASGPAGVIAYLIHMARDMSWPIAREDEMEITKAERRKLQQRSSLNTLTNYGR